MLICLVLVFMSVLTSCGSCPVLLSFFFVVVRLFFPCSFVRSLGFQFGSGFAQRTARETLRWKYKPHKTKILRRRPLVKKSATSVCVKKVWRKRWTSWNIKFWGKKYIPEFCVEVGEQGVKFVEFFRDQESNCEQICWWILRITEFSCVVALRR